MLLMILQKGQWNSLQTLWELREGRNILQVVEANHKERPNLRGEKNRIYELYCDYFVFKTLLFVGMVNIELIFIWKKYTVCRFYSNYWTVTWLSGLIEGTIEAW